jgi:hypothetical protein
MKKWLLIFVAILGFSSLAGAQRFSIGGGISGSFGSGGSAFSFGVNFGIDDLARIGPIGVDARFDLEGGSTGGGFAFAISAAALGTFQVAQFTLYAGPRVTFLISPVQGFGFGALAGARYAIAAGLSAYGELKLLFSPAFAWEFGVGVRLSL